MKIRIRKTPVETELDGVRLDQLRPGAVRDVSSGLATWLVAERYADVEMRQDVRNDAEDFSEVKDIRTGFRDPSTPRRRQGDY
ncbi:MAG: hypothetical protein DMF93_18415 [Acidobacteria bacterium]|nr:MAG: hypothetical protein DMF93_18415 [Acidobacteriota bacterium]